MEYAQLLAAKHDQVGELLSSTMQAFESKVGAVTDENFWVAICATLLTGAKLARQLGAELNVAAMDTFLQRAFIKNRETRKKEGTEGGSYDNTEFGLADFLNFHLGQGNVMYTNILFKHKHIVVHELRPPLKGHTLTVQIARDERKIIISKRALKEYLHKTGIHTRQILDGLEKYFRAREIKVTLGAGTVYAQAQEPCVEIMVPIGQPLLEDILTAQGEPK
jgi:hypothetical protein